ncbi:MAG: thioredoxin family protein [Candidatus Heimdallarchaeota archaeon]|nr:thioredoxin family protein [Candidatus Heimdallarchaeota archaeon]
MSDMKLIQVVGKGCKKCEKQYELVLQAVKTSGKENKYKVEHFTDITKFADLDIFLTPALRIDGKIVSEGRVIGVEKIKKML